MVSYEVTVWLHRVVDEPAIVTIVEAGSAPEAMAKVLRSVGLPGAAQVEVSTAGGLLLWQWRLVVLLSGRRFMYWKEVVSWC